MQKYLVTGAMGFIGSHWCEHLLKKGKLVYGFDLAPHYPKLIEHDNFTYIHDTIKNYNMLEKAVGQVDCICHLAGIATPGQYVKFPHKVMDITAVAGIELIEMCRLSGKLFFFTSTSEIYGKNKKVPFKEDDDRILGSTTTKRWCYSTSKALLEHYLDACAHSKELNNVIVRLFNVYGPRLRGRVVTNFLNNALSGEDIVVHGEGKQTRSFTYIDDVVLNIMKLIKKFKNSKRSLCDIFNIGNPKSISLKKFIDVLEKSTGKKAKKIYTKKHPGDLTVTRSNVKREKNIFNHETRVPLKEGIMKLISWHKSYYK